MSHTLSEAGLTIDLPSGWEGQIRPASASPPTEAARPAAITTDLAVLHAASFALPPGRGDYGSGAVEGMGPADILVCLLEHHPDEVDQPLFARHGTPRLLPQLFSPSQMQRTIAGMAGAQQFFQSEHRTFCLYVVLGSFRSRAPLARTADEITRTLVVTPR